MVKKVEKWQSARGELFETEHAATIDELRHLFIDHGFNEAVISRFLERVVEPYDELSNFVNLIQRVHALRPTKEKDPLAEFRHEIPPVSPPFETHHRQSVAQKYGV